MTPCSLTAQAGCQRHLSKALTACQGRNPSSARGPCDPRSPLASAIPRRSTKLSNSDSNTTYPVAPRVSQNGCRSLDGCLSSSRCLETVSPARPFSLIGLRPVPTPAVHYLSRSYASRSKNTQIPTKPNSKPSNVVAPRRPKDKVIALPKINRQPPVKRQPGLRDDSARLPIAAEKGTYKESAVNLRRADEELRLAREELRRAEEVRRLEFRRAEQARRLDRLRTIRRITKRNLPRWERYIKELKQKIQTLDQAHSDMQTDLLDCRRLLWISIERLRVEYVSKLREFKPQLPYLIADTNDHVTEVDTRIRGEIERSAEDVGCNLLGLMMQFRGVIQQICEPLEKKLEIVKAQMVQIEEIEEALRAEEEDREHERASSQRDAVREAWWTDFKKTFALSTTDEKKSSADTTAKIARWHEECEEFFNGYVAELSWYYFDNEIPNRLKELLYKIHTTLLEILEIGEHIHTEAHFARQYRRIGQACNFDFDCFSYELKYATLRHAAGRLVAASKVRTWHIGSYSQSLWRWWSTDSRVRGPRRPNRLTDLCFLVHETAEDVERTIYGFHYGVLSEDCPSKEMQMRRAQAAVSEPFRQFIKGNNQLQSLLTALHKAWRSEGNIEFLREYRNGLAYKKRDFYEVFIRFTIANWRSNKHRVAPRTIFLKPQSQSEPVLSPVVFNVPAGYPTRSDWNYNDYRSLDGKEIPIFYGRDAVSMHRALMDLQHNGVVAVDVRWAPGKKTNMPKEKSVASRRRKGGTQRDTGRQILPDSSGHDVSVVTLSTQSQIVVCHLALSKLYKPELNLPRALRLLLEDPKLIKVGMDIDGLQTRFEKYLGISMTGTCDVGSLDASCRSFSLAGAQGSRSVDLRRLVNEYFKMNLPGISRTGEFWLDSLSVEQLGGVASRAYACLRLFFLLTKSMLDATSERLIPVKGCNDEIVQKLRLLFPAAAKDVKNVVPGSIQDSTETEARKDASPSSQHTYEKYGPLIVSTGSFGWGKIARAYASTLADDKVKERPELSSMHSSLRLYYLWHTLGWGCDHIEALLPQRQANLPALILEVIEKGGLPYQAKAHEDLQKMALVQLNTTQKLPFVEEQTRLSWITELPTADLNQQVTGLMALVRAKTEAERWMNVAAKIDLFQVSRKQYQVPLSFAMWKVGGASPENIGRLLLETKSRIAASILDGAQRFIFRESLPRKALEDVAQMTENPPFWLKQMATWAVKAETQPGKPTAKKVIRSMTEDAAWPTYCRAIAPPSAQHKGIAARYVKPPQPKLTSRQSVHNSLRRTSQSRKDSTHVGLVRKTIGCSDLVDSRRKHTFRRVLGEMVPTSSHTKHESRLSANAPTESLNLGGLAVRRVSTNMSDTFEAQRCPSPRPAEATSTTSNLVKKNSRKTTQEPTLSDVPKKKKTHTKKFSRDSLVIHRLTSNESGGFRATSEPRPTRATSTTNVLTTKHASNSGQDPTSSSFPERNNKHTEIIFQDNLVIRGCTRGTAGKSKFKRRSKPRPVKLVLTMKQPVNEHTPSRIQESTSPRPRKENQMSVQEPTSSTPP